jgi:hypothetical protein
MTQFTRIQTQTIEIPCTMSGTRPTLECSFGYKANELIETLSRRSEWDGQRSSTQSRSLRESPLPRGHIPKRGTVLIVAPPNESADVIFAGVLRCGGFLLQRSCYREARSLLQDHDFTLVLCSDTLPDAKYQDVIAAARPVPVIVLSRVAEWDPYLVALHAGAFDYIACPPDPTELNRI